MSRRERLLVLALAAALPAHATVLPADPIHGEQFECGHIAYAEAFAVDGAWPPAWSVAGNVAVADVVSGRGRLRPSPTGYSLARMQARIATHDVELTFAFLMEDQATQGVGFYVRQNAGYLDQSSPTGQGYVVFVAGTWFDQPMGVWKEQNGAEIRLAASSGVAFPSSNTLYRVRFRVTQATAGSTRLQARYWPDGQAEPLGWQAEAVDASVPQLQNLTDGIAIDSWSNLRTPTSITAHTFVDDIELRVLCPPF